jgi:RimJ/RimL family protein N-acetyltransferase
MILETERLRLREMDSALDAEFIFELLNTPKFIKYIGNRGVLSAEQAREFIDNKYRQSYRDYGYGLYIVVSKTDDIPVGVCGFVKRDHFEFPDLGFAFLPKFESKGYGFESANGALEYGRGKLNFTTVLAITTQDNEVSVKLLEKLGFRFDGIFKNPEGEELKLFQKSL